MRRQEAAQNRADDAELSQHGKYRRAAAKEKLDSASSDRDLSSYFDKYAPAPRRASIRAIPRDLPRSVAVSLYPPRRALRTRGGGRSNPHRPRVL